MQQQSLQHIAIIPDGNRRWAKQKGKLAVEGHKYAVEHTLLALYDELLKLKIPYCTFWALSPENFVKRSSFEVNNLLMLMSQFLDARLQDMHSKNIKIKTIGDLAQLPEKSYIHIKKAVEQTKNNTGLVFIFAINYGGRDEVVRGINSLLQQKETTITKEQFANYLDTKDVPDPDLIIRTGGEKRTSGFLLWQSEYTEYEFVDTLFPDFSPLDLNRCIDNYYSRQRRFGS